MIKHLSFLPKKSPVRARAVLSAGAVLGLSAVMTFALFTDDGYVASTFSTGTVNLTFDNAQDGSSATPYALTSLGISIGKIGSSTISPLTVHNAGTLPFNYSATTTSTGAPTLASALQVTIVSLGASGTCDGTTSFASPLYTGSSLNATSIASRTLPAGTSEVLCFKVNLPTTGTDTSDNAIQGLTTTAKFAFAAVQS
ncbi:hypothetical protein E3T46_07895 [Cryobacterium sp. Hh11]|uniref:hypothetical protein n=1 Tax=Cryobacterium sp. Hh11 TaxID=2555868 RepID=UPI00106B913E|nr:hypothetical protein [Cryobacterium sp. Hh11]TFD52002.1 hypothetical protein E3T46_07895 [Cryobacterium sp. Hh11]